MQPAQPMSPGPLEGARHVVLPDGIVSSALPAVRGTCQQLGLDFDPWQVDAARCILAKDKTGDYAADTVVLSIPRQVGKTFLVGLLVFADAIINPGTTTVWTAHRFKVARETFNELRGIAMLPALAPHVDPDAITTAAGNESIPFRNGSRIVFAARERGAIRGFTKVRRLVLDEGQILTEAAMSDLAPTQNQADNPQLIIMGTPPKPSDPGETFTNLRTEALEGSSDGLVYIEFSADPGCDLDDVEAWEVANPSLYHRTPVKAIRRLRKLLSSDDDFAREALGIWSDGSGSSLVDMTVWAELNDPGSERPAPVAFGVGVSPDRKWSTIGLAGVRKDGSRFVQVVESGRGTGWVVERLVELAQQWKPVGIAVDASGPASSLLSGLAHHRVKKVHALSTRDVARGCGLFVDGVTDGTLFHDGGRLLTVSLEVARKRRSGEAWVWAPPNDDTDIAPLQAVTAALQILSSESPKKRQPPKVVVMR